jgi:hypothetical protein
MDWKRNLFISATEASALEWRLVPEVRRPLSNDEKPRASFRIIGVRQRHERSGHLTTLLDAESMGETKTDVRARDFSYQLDGVADAEIKRGDWLLGPRDELGVIMSATTLGPWKSGISSLTRVEIRARFDEPGLVRLNESWRVFHQQPLTRRLLLLWEKRMTDGANQYYRQVLPAVIDAVMFEPGGSVDGEEIQTIRSLQEQILRRAVRLAETQNAVRLTSAQLVRATQDALRRA